MLYIEVMNKPESIESVLPLSGEYSLARDFRLNRWLLVAAVIYPLEVFLMKCIPEMPAFWRGVLAVAPLFPGLLYIRSWLRFIGGLDEFQRRLQLEAFLFAALGSLIIGAVAGSLAARGIPLGPLQHGLTLGGAFFTMIILWTARTLVLRARYK